MPPTPATNGSVPPDFIDSMSCTQMRIAAVSCTEYTCRRTRPSPQKGTRTSV